MSKVWEFFGTMDTLVYVNQKVLRMYGFTPWQKFLGKNVMRFFRIVPFPAQCATAMNQNRAILRNGCIIIPFWNGRS